MLTIQYLEDSPTLAGLRVEDAVDLLRRAAERVPFTHLLIGWHLPPHMLDACRAEAQRLGVRFLRWEPLLTGSIDAPPPADRQVVGLSGQRVRGFRDLPEFTFACPNHPALQEDVLNRLQTLAKGGLYQGLFLDRVRFPSAAADPLNDLGCFCEHCRRRAAALGLDLEQARRELMRLGGDAEGTMTLALSLLGPRPALGEDPTGELLRRFFDFRSRCLTDFVRLVAAELRAAGMQVGLDCFSPGLTRMVGQDLTALSAHADWIKVMTYAHALGPAGLPFELLGMCNYLTAHTGRDETDVLRRMATALELPLPASCAALQEDGLSALALQQEVEAGVRLSRAPVLAGVELVDGAAVAHRSSSQLRADLEAVRQARPAGLSLSWDLLHIPLERLDAVRAVYLHP